jgi:hypothetical protein
VPPTVSRQTPPRIPPKGGSSTAPPRTGTRAASSTPAPRTGTSTDPDPWGAADAVRMLIYGQSGTGKTTLAAKLPDPLLWLVCSGGSRPGELKSIDTPENRRRITPVIIDSMDRFVEAMRGADDYATVVLDHASGFSDLLIKEMLGLDEIPVSKAKKAGKGESWSLVSQQQYGQLGVMLKETFRAMLNHRANVVILAQERTFGGKEDGLDPEVVRPFVGPALTPSVTGWLAPACDFVVQTFKRPRMEDVVTVVAGKELRTRQRGVGVEYCLRVGPHETFMTKFRTPGGVKEDVIVDPTYEKLLEVMRGSNAP